MVWFQIETFPNFDKLYGEISGKITKGTNYTLDVTHNTDYSQFDVDKYFVLSTTSFTGRNWVLPAIFIWAWVYVLGLIVAFCILERMKVSNKLCWEKKKEEEAKAEL